MEFFLSFFKIILFLIYTRRLNVYLQEEQWVMVYPGDVVVREKGEILKSFSIKRQWIPVFLGVWFDCQLGWAHFGQGGPSRGGIAAGKIPGALEALWEALERGV